MYHLAEFYDSHIKSIHPEAFQDLTDVNRISFTNVKFSGEINTNAITNVTVGHFSISDSSIQRIEHEAFDLTITDKFVMKRTRINHIEDHSFYNIRSTKSSALPVVSLVNVSTSDVEVNGFKIRDK